MGQAMGSMGKVFNPNSDMVQGTGLTVGELKNLPNGQGYSNQDIQTMGGGQPSFGVGLARNLLRGGLKGVGNGLQAYGQQSQGRQQMSPMFQYGAPRGLNPYQTNNTNSFYGE